jgi:hypothetical protein
MSSGNSRPASPSFLREVLDQTGLGHLTPPETTSRSVELLAVCGVGPTPPNASPEPLRHPRSLKGGDRHFFRGPIPDVWQEMQTDVQVVPYFWGPRPAIASDGRRHGAVRRIDSAAQLPLQADQ